MSTLSTASASASADAVVDRLDEDSPTVGYMEVYDDVATLLCTVDFAAVAFGSAVDGVANAASLPLSSAAAVAAGTAATFTCFTGGGSVVFSGTVGGTLESTTGDLQLDTTEIVIGDIVTITALTYTAPLTVAA